MNEKDIEQAHGVNKSLDTLRYIWPNGTSEVVVSPDYISIVDHDLKKENKVLWRTIRRIVEWENGLGVVLPGDLVGPRYFFPLPEDLKTYDRLISIIEQHLVREDPALYRPFFTELKIFGAAKPPRFKHAWIPAGLHDRTRSNKLIVTLILVSVIVFVAWVAYMLVTSVS